MGTYFQGFILGLAYVAPIGVQNLFVIKNALQGIKTKACLTAIFVILNDILLACACYFGIGNVLTRYPRIRIPMVLGGSFIILYIALSLWRSKITNLYEKQPSKLTASQIFITSFAVTWLNPQALLDGTLLFGGVRASLAGNHESFFIIGFASASLIWFSSLTSIVLLTRKSFTTRIQVIVNKICSLILLLFSLKLLSSIL